ncbi:hypothetical protein UWK_01692 [Desulfocapsa sulfexigens DSM 10523]|uniref:Phospholipase A2 n=1 Tax=Desulfocapsa sulfexigens (strain DSM 10523 / SB164P1) TaxID=1167006 RepID=M1PEW7_DESSD|nr:hypothetical protein [Desulfocapsa sulfexigens]AGF78250.1 hypothetical protein UWK_01692 [Desulfocapsa sulfexigens DSM 10523]
MTLIRDRQQVLHNYFASSSDDYRVEFKKRYKQKLATGAERSYYAYSIRIKKYNTEDVSKWNLISASASAFNDSTKHPPQPSPMKHSKIKLTLAILAILAVLFILITSRDTSTESVSSLQADVDTLERHLELILQEKLLLAKNNPNASLTKFVSDGCSGGLSVGWEYLADRVPGFEKTHGNTPPWQVCCEIHDLAYHTGGAKTDTAVLSFEARRKADLDLKACVIETGDKRSAALTKAYTISETELKQIYAGIANIMYGAVRIGGMPCTDLPWRWGFGWPECK